ncbi:MAG TPA: isoprenylcysteine carboxylmethyltransferase family protein [Acidimicrobiales bacterium]
MEASTMQRRLFMAYGTVAYAAFLVTFVYAIGFVQRVGVPKHIDDGAAVSWPAAVAVDLGLLALFAAQHSLMARPGFKRRWTRLVPRPIERSTYVLAATAALALLMWQWRPLPGTVWDVEGAARTALWGLSWLGWVTVLGTTFLINHFDLFGLRQAYRHLRSRPPARPAFRTPLLYRLVRHPLMLGFLVAFWAAPTMSRGHLLFSACTSAYILLALQLEERDLLAEFGDEYAAYRSRVPMLVPGLGGAGRRRQQRREAPLQA